MGSPDACRLLRRWEGRVLEESPLLAGILELKPQPRVARFARAARAAFVVSRFVRVRRSIKETSGGQVQAPEKGQRYCPNGANVPEFAGRDKGVGKDFRQKLQPAFPARKKGGVSAARNESLRRWVNILDMSDEPARLLRPRR